MGSPSPTTIHPLPPPPHASMRALYAVCYVAIESDKHRRTGTRTSTEAELAVLEAALQSMNAEKAALESTLVFLFKVFGVCDKSEAPWIPRSWN